MFSTENWLRLYIKFSKFYPMYLMSCAGRASARPPKFFIAKRCYNHLVFKGGW
jgi:hypothetical protein